MTTRLEPVGEPDTTQTARWAGGSPAKPLDADESRALWWSRQAPGECWAHSNAADAFQAWTVAVEGTWWAAALNALYRDVLVGSGTYDAVIDKDAGGVVVHGLRWLRHAHIHDIHISGYGGPKVDFFGGPGVLNISP